MIRNFESRWIFFILFNRDVYGLHVRGSFRYKPSIHLTVMPKESISVHRTTPAEAAIMATVDSLIDGLQQGEPILIDYDFLRDYTISRLQSKYFALGERAYTAKACASVGVSRYYYVHRNLGHLKYTR